MVLMYLPTGHRYGSESMTTVRLKIRKTQFHQNKWDEQNSLIAALTEDAGCSVFWCDFVHQNKRLQIPTLLLPQMLLR